MSDGESRIIRDLNVLTEQFIPSRVIHRDGQLKLIRDDLKPILNEMNARNIFLHGRPGTGKTCMARYVVSELKEQAPILTSYINCWECRSRFKILFNLLQDFGLKLSVHRRGQPTDELLEMLRNKIKDQHCVVILDEVDQLEDSKILYDLTNIPRISMILIANSETALHSIEPRIRSRLMSSDRIEFPSYNDSEILDILKDRVGWGLVPDTIKNQQLESIANACGGDARIAINTLRIVSEDAENQDVTSISDQFINKAISNITTKKQKRLEELNSHEKIIVDILRDNKNLETGELFRRFQELTEKQGIEKVVDRTFRKYMDTLVKHGFVTSSGEARWRTYTLV
ncbi:Cdc6/Cdc18 family protein [Candidatus Aenigmatarchaeota archaeon]